MEEKITIGKIAVTVYDAAQKGIDQAKELDYEKRNLQKKIACRIKELRQANRLTQEQVSEIVNCNSLTYRGYENLRSLIPDAIIVRLADLYNVSLDYIMGRTDNMKGMYATTDEEADAANSDLSKRIAKLEKIVQLQKIVKDLANDA